MKRATLIFTLTALAAVNSASSADVFPKLTGPYLGQKPPGTIPELFALGIVSVDKNFEHSTAAFSPDNKEIFWCTNVDWYTDKKVYSQNIFS